MSQLLKVYSSLAIQLWNSFKMQGSERENTAIIHNWVSRMWVYALTEMERDEDLARTT
jgi:hypothetical protein